ncbi:MAG: hypothetical protein ABEH83_11845 [Halobacterium sp.]
MTDFEAEPPGVAVAPAAVASLFVFAGSLASTTGVALSAAGAALLVYGTHSGTRRFVTLGGGALFLAVVFSGTAGLDTRYALVAAAAALVAYDAGEHAVSLGHDVGRDGRVGAALLVHVAITTSVALLVAAFAYAVYEFGPGSLPVGALVALLVAGVLLAYTLRE